MIEMYSTHVCPYCDRAKDLLRRKGVQFVEHHVDEDINKREEMLARSGGRRTVPQIFIDGKHIGGCDDLHELDRVGKLNSLLDL